MSQYLLARSFTATPALSTDPGGHLQSHLHFLSCKEIFYKHHCSVHSVHQSGSIPVLWEQEGEKESLLHMGKPFTSKIL